MIGRPRATVEALPAYRPGRSAEQAAAEHGIAEAIKLASNELPWGPLPSVRSALATATDDVHLYADHRSARLRGELAQRHALDPSRVMVGCGSAGLLQQLALSYLDPGDRVVYGWPSFEAYPIFVQLAGAEARPVELRRQTVVADALAEAVDERTKLVLLANPNNPTGTAVGLDDVQRLLEACPPTCLVVLDEAYREFVDHPALGDPIPLLDEYPHLVILRTFSKAHGLAGLRVGYGFAHTEVASEVDKTLLPFAVNGLGQAAASASLAANDEMTERVDQVVAERERVARALRELGWSVPRSQANFVWLPAGAASADLGRELEQAGYVTRAFPGVGVRVTVADPETNDAFLAAFATVSSTIDPASWETPTGELAARVQGALDDLDAALARLEAHADGGRPDGLTEADEATGERWEAAQVWAHLAEFGGYWLPQLRLIVDAGSDEPVPFGRTKRDPHRIAMIERHRHDDVAELVATVRADIARFADELAQLAPEDWSQVGRHETLGDLDLWQFLDHFVTGHYHEHADQLDGLAGA
ncbi:MAG: histidinol-phosphate transaminase [Actinomycetota bacterium]